MLDDLMSERSRPRNLKYLTLQKRQLRKTPVSSSTLGNVTYAILQEYLPFKIPSVQMESIKKNYDTFLARAKNLDRTWINIKKDYPKSSQLTFNSNTIDIPDKFYRSALALADIIDFNQYGLKEKCGCARYYWSHDEEFDIIPTNDQHKDFHRSHYSHDFIDYQKKQINVALQNLEPKTRKLTLNHYMGISKRDFEATLDSASQTLDTIHTALIKLVKERYSSKLITNLIDMHHDRRANSAEGGFHLECWEQYKLHAAQTDQAPTKKRKKGPETVETAVLVSEISKTVVPPVVTKKRKYVITDNDESPVSKQVQRQKISVEDLQKNQVQTSSLFLASVASPVNVVESNVVESSRNTRSANTSNQGLSPQLVTAEEVDHIVDSKDDDSERYDPNSGQEQSTIVKDFGNLKSSHTYFVDLLNEDGPEEVDVPEDTIAESKLEKLSEDPVVADWKKKLEITKTDLVLSFKDMLSISVDRSCNTVAQSVPITSIGLDVKTKDSNIVSMEHAALTVLRNQGAAATKYDTLKNFIVGMLLNDPKSIKFNEIEYDYLSENLISYCGQCKNLAKITVTNLSQLYPNDADIVKLKKDLYQANQTIQKSLNGFVFYIMSEFYEGAIDKGEKFVAEHLAAVASCRFACREVLPRCNMDDIKHEKIKIDEIGEEILREMHGSSSTAIGQSNKEGKKFFPTSVTSEAPTVLVNKLSSSISENTPATSSKVQVLDDYDGELNDLMALCAEVQRAVLIHTGSPHGVTRDSHIGTDADDLHSQLRYAEDADVFSPKSVLLFVITANAKRHIDPDIVKQVHCFTTEVFKSLKDGEFFFEFPQFKEKYEGQFEVYEHSAVSMMDPTEFKLFNYPDDVDIERYFPPID